MTSSEHLLLLLLDSYPGFFCCLTLVNAGSSPSLSANAERYAGEEPRREKDPERGLPLCLAGDAEDDRAGDLENDPERSLPLNSPLPGDANVRLGEDWKFEAGLGLTGEAERFAVTLDVIDDDERKGELKGELREGAAPAPLYTWRYYLIHRHGSCGRYLCQRWRAGRRRKCRSSEIHHLSSFWTETQRAENHRFSFHPLAHYQWLTQPESRRSPTLMWAHFCGDSYRCWAEKVQACARPYSCSGSDELHDKP